MVETQRARRGHEFLPASLARTIPKLYATENIPLDDKIVHAHYFGGPYDAYITELAEDGVEAFGYTKLTSYPDGEWGYIDLSELEEHKGGLVIIERDCYWKPERFADAMARLYQRDGRA